MTDEWLSLSNAAKLLGVHPNTLLLWSDKGMLPVHLTQGGHRRYKRDQVLLRADANQRSRVIEPETMMQEAIKMSACKFQKDACKQNHGIKNWMRMRACNIA